jgi:hypothetical protein
MNIYDEIENAVKAIKSSPYVVLVVLLLQYIEWYCCGDAPCDLPESIENYIDFGKSNGDPLIATLANSDISEECQFLACHVYNYAVAKANDDLVEDLEYLRNFIFASLEEDQQSNE